jgi:hypothetical protein
MVAHSRTSLRVDRLRPLNLPRPVDIELDHHTLPTAVTSEGRRKVVESVREIWQVDDEWWRDRLARRYVEVVLAGGGHVVLYEDQMTGKWFMQDP